MRTLFAIWLPTTFTTVCVFLAIYLSLMFIVPVIFGIGDARARYSEFLRFRNHKSIRVLDRMKKSACQRFAAISSHVNPREARQYYLNQGYRWYNVLPDGSFSIKDNCYLKLNFYLNLLGMKRN